MGILADQRLPSPTALSIARPLTEALADQPFEGRVLGRFARACNLADAAGRLLVLALPEVGNGPFTLVVSGEPGLFGQLSVGQPAMANQYSLTLGRWRLDLRRAKIWEPRLVCPAQPLNLSPAVVSMLKPFANWPGPTETSPLLYERLVAGAAQLNSAISQAANSHTSQKIGRAAGQLAGLGQGLTPAGDDYLVGVMAALWLTGHQKLLPEMAITAAPQTTTLSAAFLSAAAQGQFIEPWHGLVQALLVGEIKAVEAATARVAQFGASSGRDGLAGFTATLLNLAGEGALIQCV